MEIIEVKIMRGPNCWSLKYKNLIVLKLSDDGSIFSPEHAATIFSGIRETMPQLLLNEKNEGHIPDIAMLTALIAMRLQQLAGINSEYAYSEPVLGNPGYYSVFSYLIENAGLSAGEAAVRIINAIAENKPYNFQEDIDYLVRLKNRFGLGPTAGYILNEVIRRHIPFRSFNSGSLVRLGHGIKQKMIRTAVTSITSGLGMEMAGDKNETKHLLNEAHLPTPGGIVVYSEKELYERIYEVKFPLVVKPLDGNHGRGVTTDINSIEDAIDAYQRASLISSGVIVEEFIKGDDYRFLVIDYKLAAVTKRTPASVTGDGHSTIAQLVDRENKSSDRGKSDDVLAIIKIDDITQKILREKQLTVDSILPEGKTLILKDTANISAGGTATDLTDSIHPANKFMAERIARLFNLDICGVDIVTTGIEAPITRETGAIIEVNAGPGLRMHSNPQKGEARDVAGLVMDMLFPTPEAPFIPVIAIAEAPGDTITARFITDLAKQAGYKCGYTGHEGIYIQDHPVLYGNAVDYWSAQDVLFDPDIDFAVLVCGWYAMFRSGLSFDTCDILIITDPAHSVSSRNNIDIENFKSRLEDLFVRSIKHNGHTILNADDEQILRLLHSTKSEIALFSMNADNPHIIQHSMSGGLTAVFDKNKIVINLHGKITSLDLDTISIFREKKNTTGRYILPSVLAAVICGFNMDIIREGLLSFRLDPEAVDQLPI